jgi:hypothetical protein
MLTEADLAAAWGRYCKEHIQPSILFRIALGPDVPDAEQRRHLKACERCRAAFDHYREK